MTNEELRQEVKRLEEQITNLRIKILESKADKKPYEVEVPGDIGNYYYVSELGDIDLVEDVFHDFDYEGLYLRGLAFKTVEEAEQYDKERILINRAKDWAKKYNEGWTHNLKNVDKEKYIIRYDYEYNQFAYVYSCYHNDFSKLPVFKTEETAEQFIEEFGGEIEEVFC